MLNKFKRIKDDSGNGVVILGMLLIMSLLLVGGMMLDFTKAYQLKHAYVDSAKKATQSGVRYQDTKGYLTNLAGAEAVLSYETVMRPSVIGGGPLAYCGNAGRDVDITVTYKGEGFSSGPKFDIKSSQVTGDLKSIAAKMKIPENIENGGYTGLEMTVAEQTPNLVLPGALSINKISKSTVDKMKCQEIGVKAGASKFLGETGQFD